MAIVLNTTTCILNLILMSVFRACGYVVLPLHTWYTALRLPGAEYAKPPHFTTLYSAKFTFCLLPAFVPTVISNLGTGTLSFMWDFICLIRERETCGGLFCLKEIKQPVSCHCRLECSRYKTLVWIKKSRSTGEQLWKKRDHSVWFEKSKSTPLHSSSKLLTC